MSLDSSLKSKSALERSRNVLTRAERIEVLKQQERWTEESGVFGLPKVAQRRKKVAKPKAAATPTDQEQQADEGTEGSAESSETSKR